MAIDLWDDMGDVYAAADAVTIGWGTAPNSIQTGRLGGGCFRLTSRSTVRAVAAGASRTVGFAWRPASTTGSGILFTFLESTTVHVNLEYNGDGTLSVTRNGTALTGGTTAAVITAGAVWYAIELAVTVNDTTGAFELRVNGSTVASGSSVDTRNGGASGTISVTRFNGRGTNDDYDDFWSATGFGAFEGDLRVCSDLPNSDGGVSQWTPSTGSAHYAMVDDSTPGGDTDYLSDATAGHRDVFGYPALAVGSSAAVKGVMVRMWARKDDAGTRTIDAVARISGTNYDAGYALALSTSYNALEAYMLSNPATAAAWTVTQVNAAELGIKEVA